MIDDAFNRAVKKGMIKRRLDVPTVRVKLGDDYDIYVGRNSKYGDPKWGNPFKVEKYGREGAIRQHEQWLYQVPLRNDIYQLIGKKIACHCELEEDCHGDTLAAQANKLRLQLNGKFYPPKRFLICGIREWPYYFPILMLVGGLKRVYGDDIVIIHGAQGKRGRNGNRRGVDQFAGRAAEELGLEVDPYPADWRLGKAAGFLRNQQMLDEGKPDRVVAVGRGVGTNDMAQRGYDAGLLVTHRYYDYTNASFT